jgi:inhibitor of cysteine peptidase
MELDYNSSGKTIEVPLNETIVLRLGENPTTGHRWQVRGVYDQVLELLSDKFERRSGEMRYGAGGTRVWTFRAKATGAVLLELEYVRPGAASPPAASRFSVNIRVV